MYTADYFTNTVSKYILMMNVFIQCYTCIALYLSICEFHFISRNKSISTCINIIQKARALYPFKYIHTVKNTAYGLEMHKQGIDFDNCKFT